MLDISLPPFPPPVAEDVPLMRTYPLTSLQPSSKYDLKVTAYNSAGATPGLYAVITPALDKGEATFQLFQIYCYPCYETSIIHLFLGLRVIMLL